MLCYFSVRHFSVSLSRYKLLVVCSMIRHNVASSIHPILQLNDGRLGLIDHLALISVHHSSVYYHFIAQFLKLGKENFAAKKT